MYKIIAMGTHANADIPSGFHSHDYWEFVYYIEGYGSILSENMTLDFHPNLLVCNPPHIPHSELPSGKFSNIYFITDAQVSLPADKCFVYEDRAMHELEYIFKQLRIHYFRRHGNWKEINHALISLLLELLKAKLTIGSTESYIEIVESEIINNFANKDFKLSDTFEKVPMAREYFMTLFKQSTGMTPLEYLTDKRIENAKQLLLLNDHTRTSISSIAEMSGFSDVYYFSRVFKKQTGLSPLNWFKANKS